MKVTKNIPLAVMAGPNNQPLGVLKPVVIVGVGRTKDELSCHLFEGLNWIYLRRSMNGIYASPFADMINPDVLIGKVRIRSNAKSAAA